MKLSKDDLYFKFENYDSENPTVWSTLWHDQSIPMDEEAKKAQLLNLSSFSRQYLLPFIKCFAFFLKVFVFLIKLIIPFRFRAHSLLHFLISHGLYWFVRPEANFLILRHLHLGSNILKFLSQNLNCEDFPSQPLYPKTVWSIRPNQIIQHDVNLFNFVTYFNKTGSYPTQGEKLNFDAIKTIDLRLQDMPKKWTNSLDVESAIELVAPLFHLLTTDEEFWRASISLQLDETIASIFCRLVGNYDRLSYVVNKHPLFPNSTLEASRRLGIHGLSTEILHEILVNIKNEQK